MEDALRVAVEQRAALGVRSVVGRVELAAAKTVVAADFEVAYGLFPREPNQMAVVTRSMMEIMVQLGFGIELPPEDVARGRVLPGKWQAGDAKAKPLVDIKSGPEAPDATYAAVRYKDNWYWIADDDIASKRTFTFLMILFSLAETGQGTAAPVVTVPSR